MREPWHQRQFRHKPRWRQYSSLPERENAELHQLLSNGQAEPKPRRLSFSPSLRISYKGQILDSGPHPDLRRDGWLCGWRREFDQRRRRSNQRLSITVAHHQDGFVGVAYDGIAGPGPDAYVSTGTPLLRGHHSGGVAIAVHRISGHPAKGHLGRQARAIITWANWPLVRNATSSGTPASQRRSQSSAHTWGR